MSQGGLKVALGSTLLLSASGWAALPGALPPSPSPEPGTPAGRPLLQLRTDPRTRVERLGVQWDPRREPVLLGGVLAFSADDSARWVVSPDGERVFFVERKGLGSALALAERLASARKNIVTPGTVTEVRDLTLAPGGQLHFVVEGNALASVASDGGHYHRVALRPSDTAAELGGIWNLSLGPDGRHAIFRNGVTPAKLMSVELESGKLATLDSGDGDPQGCRNYAYSFGAQGQRVLFQCRHSDTLRFS